MSRTPRRLLAATTLVSVLLAVVTVPGAVGGSPNRVELTGRLEVVHGDEFGDHRAHAHGSAPDHVLPNMRYWLDNGGKTYELEFPGNPPSGDTGDRVTVRGERRGNKIHVAAMQTSAAAGGKGGKKQPPQPTTAYLGPRDVLAIAITFAADPRTPYTIPEIREQVFTGTRSAANYVSETSLRKASLQGKNDGSLADKDGLPGDVAGWFTINESTNNCSRDRWATAARNAATSAGWDLTGYEHLAYVFPQVAACSWGGLGEMGGDETWYNGWNKGSVYAHEFGHNFTLFHARTLSCKGSDGQAVVLSSSCTYLEYGDPFDVMGWSGRYHHFNVRNKRRISWLDGANVTDAAPGVEYTLQPMEAPSSGLQLLRFRRNSSEFFYVEARTVHPEFDAFAPGEDVVTGALIHTGADVTSSGNSYLLDTAPYPPPPPNPVYSDEFFDAALQPGEAFVDPASGVSIETTSANNGTVTVVVRTGVVNAAPAAIAGAGHSIPVALPHRHDGASATDANKNLSSYRWAWTSCPGTCPALTGTEGQLSGGSDDVPGPTFTPAAAGTYRLSLTVRDSSGVSVTSYVDEIAA